MLSNTPFCISSITLKTILHSVLWLTMLTQTVNAQSVQPPKIMPSVMVFTQWQLDNFPNLVKQVLDAKPPAINVVLTSQVLLNADLTIKQFGLIRSIDGSPFEPWSDATRETTRASLAEGFKLIRDANIPLSVLPHVDATGDLQDWRNNFVFDPLVKVDGNCYADSMVYDVMTSLEMAGMQNHQIQFNMAGEMGQTVFQFASSYTKIADDLRSKYPWKQLRIGMGLNHGSLFGKSPINETTSAAFQSLLSKIDFLGISCYHRVNVPVTAKDFEWSIEDYMKEMTAANVKVPETLPLHFCELGLGGKPMRPKDNMTVEEELAAVALDPWSGVPNGESNPWEKQHLKEFRLQYYEALFEFLLNQKGPYHVEEVALWSMGSWCPHGFLVPSSRDEAIIAKIDAFNAR
jgi:hypothetical protein